MEYIVDIVLMFVWLNTNGKMVKCVKVFLCGSIKVFFKKVDARCVFIFFMVHVLLQFLSATGIRFGPVHEFAE